MKRKNNITAFCKDLAYSPAQKDITQLIFFYNDNKRKCFPPTFQKENFFQKANEIYHQIGENRYIKQIKIATPLCQAGNTVVDLTDSKVTITITISAIKLGIGSGEGVTVLPELIDTIGIEKFGSIKDSNNKWTKLAWKIFDEYMACRKVAEKYNSFDSVESVDKIEKMYKYILEVNRYPIQMEDLLYSIATVSAFADVSQDQYSEYFDNKYKSFKILQNIRTLLNSEFKLEPLCNKMYEDLGQEFKLILQKEFTNLSSNDLELNL